jgi:hypothetical protein
MTRKRSAQFVGGDEMPTSDKRSQSIASRLISQQRERYSGIKHSRLSKRFADCLMRVRRDEMVRQHELHRASRSTRMRMLHASSEQCSSTKQQSINTLQALLDFRGGVRPGRNPALDALRTMLPTLNSGNQCLPAN